MKLATDNTDAMTSQSAAADQGPVAELDAAGLLYRQLNDRVRQAVRQGARRIVVQNVCGQRYIGTGLRSGLTLELHGTPGNDLAMFMDGSNVVVQGNAQDGTGNTMNGGEVVVHGSAGDLLAHSLRGGAIYIRGDAGYRVAIHMKEYTEPVPAVVVGGTVGDYAAEYMAGGILIVLGLNHPEGKSLTGKYLGTGMHGGAIYLRGHVRPELLGKEISPVAMHDRDQERLRRHVNVFAQHFGLDAAEILNGEFTKLAATSSRPYGRLYVY